MGIPNLGVWCKK